MSTILFLFHRFTVIRFPMVKLCKHKVSFISLRRIIKYQWDHINICHKRFTNGDKTLRNSKKPSNSSSAAMFWQRSEIARRSSSLNLFLRRILRKNHLLTSVVFMLTFHEFLKTSAKFRYCYKDLTCMKIEFNFNSEMWFSWSMATLLTKLKKSSNMTIQTNKISERKVVGFTTTCTISAYHH